MTSSFKLYITIILCFIACKHEIAIQPTSQTVECNLNMEIHLPHHCIDGELQETRSKSNNPIYLDDIYLFQITKGLVVHKYKIADRLSSHRNIALNVIPETNTTLLLVSGITFTSEQLLSYTDTATLISHMDSISIESSPYICIYRNCEVSSSGKISINSKQINTIPFRQLLSTISLNIDFKVPDYEVIKVTLHNANSTVSFFIDSLNLESSLYTPSTTPIESRQTDITTHQWEIPAYWGGINESINYPTERNHTNTPIDKCTYFTVHARSKFNSTTILYTIYPGPNLNEFSLFPNHHYHYNMTINKGEELALTDPRVSIIDGTYHLNTHGEHSNSFICKTDGWYSFSYHIPTDKEIPHGTADIVSEHWLVKYKNISKVNVIWELSASYSMNNDFDVMDDTPIIKDGKIIFKTGKNEGNVLIAACNSADEIIWSWHIWVTNEQVEGDQFLFQNLGGFSYHRFQGTTSNFGLMYQWGRKDPFFRFLENYLSPSGGIGDGKYHLLFQTTDFSKRPINNVIRATSTPYCILQYYKAAIEWTADWVIPGGFRGSIDLLQTCNLWDTTKTIHDPCPYGWRVPSWEELNKYAVSPNTLKDNSYTYLLPSNNCYAHKVEYIKPTGDYYVHLWTNTMRTESPQIEVYDPMNQDITGARVRFLPIRCIRDN